MEQGQYPIPNRLRKHRRIFGYKQKEVAQIIGVRNASDIAQWEKGVKLPNTINLLKLSILYRTFPNELYFEFMIDLRQQIVDEELKVFRNK